MSPPSLITRCAASRAALTVSRASARPSVLAWVAARSASAISAAAWALASSTVFVRYSSAAARACAAA